MRLGRLPTDSVNRKNVLGTRGKHNYAIHFGDQRHPVARPTDRRAEFEHLAVLYRDIHEKVQWTRNFGRSQPQLLQCCEQVVGAIIMVILASEEAVAIIIASSK